ncbi:MAG: OmpA family protein [Deltaproteobacteria bacterium]|nr:OmpA family protein [Deltaproteobacteria bacterium]
MMRETVLWTTWLLATAACGPATTEGGGANEPTTTDPAAAVGPAGDAPDPGAPALSAADVEARYRFVEPIEFDGGSDDLTVEGEAALRRTAERLGSHPEWLVVELESHSDPRGASGHNLDLTRHRAGLIREKLIALGIDGERLIATGYGETCPRDPRPGSRGDRRVELVVLETTDGCTGEPIGCPAAVEQLVLSSRLREYLPGSEHCGGAEAAP